MILNVDFESLDTFCAEYGSSINSGETLKVYVVGGIGVANDLKSLFRRHYLHDQWNDTKYDKWKIIDGVLHAHVCSGGTRTDEWVKYDNKGVINEVLRYEFVGDCWFVFEGISYAKCIVAEYTPDRKDFTGKQVIEEIGLEGASNPVGKEYILEGVLTIPPGPGWMTWRIQAQSFHIEISDGVVPSKHPNHEA